MSNAAAQSRPGPSRSQAGRALAGAIPLSTLGPLFALVLSCAYFASQTDRFLTGPNFSLIVQQVVVVGTLALGQTIIILTAGVDLSNGAVMGLGTIVMTKLATDGGMNAYAAMALGLATCVAFGLLNGGLITVVRLPPFIVTLGTLNIAFAIAHIYSEERSFVDLPAAMTFLGRTFEVRGTAITYGSLVMVGLYLVAWYVLRATAVGRHVYAVGNNPEAVRLAGIDTRRLLIGVYAFSALVFGIAGVLLVARTEVGDPQAGQVENLESITAVVLGGTSLFGGRGAILGTLIGALIVGVFRNGLQLIGVASIYQVLITGVLVILAVAVDQITRARRR